jgi:hypothetical protein
MRANVCAARLTPRTGEFCMRGQFDTRACENRGAYRQAAVPAVPDRGCRAGLPAPELTSGWRAAWRSTALPFVLVTKDQPAFFQVVGRHLDRHPIARQRLDPVLLHLAGGVSDDLVSGIELDTVTRVGENFSDQSFELDQLFLSHVYLQIDRRLAWSLGAVGSGIRTALTMQEGHPLHPLRLAAGLGRGRTDRLVPVGLMPAGLLSAIITTGTPVTARAF